MNNIISIDSHLDTTDESPAKTARKWRRIGYRIRGKVANLIAAKNGKKKLREGTDTRLRTEIVNDLAYIALEKKRLASQPDLLEAVLRGVSRQEQLWKQRGTGHPKPYDRNVINHLLSILPSRSDIFFVEEFLGKIIRIRKQVLDDIIIQHHLDSKNTQNHE
ncbi:MAG: hypothetical protein PHY14_01815 [Candidatus Gracilibacteria bacterium]|nr:hypothetical protein [Candidatus Gracilibacteria bacterium]